MTWREFVVLVFLTGRLPEEYQDVEYGTKVVGAILIAVDALFLINFHHYVAFFIILVGGTYSARAFFLWFHEQGGAVPRFPTSIVSLLAILVAAGAIAWSVYCLTVIESPVYASLGFWVFAGTTLAGKGTRAAKPLACIDIALAFVSAWIICTSLAYYRPSVFIFYPFVAFIFCIFMAALLFGAFPDDVRRDTRSGA